MAKMKKNRKYRSSVTSKSSWNKRVSCRQNMHKGRVKAKYKRQAKNNPNYEEQNEIWQCFVYGFIALVIFYWFSFL